MVTSALPPFPSEEELTTLATETYQRQLAYFKSGKTRPLAFRIQQLKRLTEVVRKHEAEILQALHRDLRKSAFEAYGSEIGVFYKEVTHTLVHLPEWMEPKRASTPLMFLPSSSRVIPDPLGTVLIMAPWNYPFLLMMTPLVSAIAGGNTAFIKPSEQAPHTAAIVETIVTEAFERDFVAVFQGQGHVVAPTLIRQLRFDHIFFTGNPAAGRKIMELASIHLTPVTLELGGKSPCIVDSKVNIAYAARKIAWSKMINAGQTCVAPDYLLVHESVKAPLLEAIKSQFSRMLGNDPKASPDYGRLINRKRFDAVASYLQQGEVLYGGKTDAEDLFIEPTLLEVKDAESPVMKEEIFGPILPIITYRTREEVLAWIERNPYPLALYVFTNSRDTERFYTEQVRFGGGCINNGVIHVGNPDLPFGGVGTSGMGQYHGKHGFDTFTRPKSILKTPTWSDVPLWYAPYRGNLKWIKPFFRL